MIAKFYAGESQGYSACFASLPLLAENEPNKESRTVGGEEPSLSSVLFFYSFHNLSSPVKQQNQQTRLSLYSFLAGRV